jgi:PAS domain S-box-containing protein
MRETTKEIIDLEQVILNGIPESIIYIDTDRKILWANTCAGQSVGISSEELVGKRCGEVFDSKSEICSGCPITKILETKTLHEDEFVSPDGRVWSIHAYPIFDDGGGIKGIIETRRDTTAKKITDESIRETRELFKLLAESARDLIFRYRLSPTRGFDYVSPSSTDITGYRPEEFYARRDLFFSIVHPEDQQKVKDYFEKTNNLTPVIDFRLLRKDGPLLWLELQLTPKHDVQGKLISIQGIGRDITAWRREKDRQRLVVEILEVLNQVGEKKDRIMLILLLIKDYTGFDAVGIRLKEGDDFPYYETSGFDASFVEAETHLCARDRSGEIVRDLQGAPSLECLCGSVISGKIDHILPDYTRNGSFWTNGRPDLDALSKEKIVPGLRGRCFIDGYDSVALIPLRSESEIIGLLQLNDKRSDMLTPEMIDFFEGIAVSIGIAFKRNIIEEEKGRLIHQLEESLEKVNALSGLLPICAKCKKIRDDKGYWNQIEEYIRDHSDANFTHGICPDCSKELYPTVPIKDKGTV